MRHLRRLMLAALSAATLLAAVCFIPQWEPTTARRYSALPMRCRNDGNIHVATIGDDTRGDGTACRPWATVDHAQTVVRTNNPLLPVKVEPGDYWRSTTWSLTNADSGTSYTCDGLPGACRILGGAKLSGCTLYSGAIWKCPHAGQISTLYENGIRAISARTPNLVPSARFPTSQAPYLSSAADNADHVTVTYTLGDFDPTSWSLTGAQIMTWAGGGVGFGSSHTNWVTDTIPISSINTSTHQIHLAATTNYTNAINSRYFIQGIFQLLDAQGEYWDDVANGQVYYWARSGGDPGLQETVAPTVTRLVSVSGADDSHLAQNIVLDGFTFQYSDALQTIQSAGFDPVHLGLIYLHEADTVTIKNSILANSGMAGIVADDTHNENHVIQHYWIEHVGSYGIIAENVLYGLGVDGDHVKGWTMDDFQIDHYGELNGGSTGMQFYNSGHHTISHFDISHGPRSALSIYSPIDVDTTQVYSGGSTFSYGNIWAGAENSGDIGVISTSGFNTAPPPYIFNTFNQVYVHTTFADPTMLDAKPNAVFTDYQGSGQHWNNVQAIDADTATSFRFYPGTPGLACCQVTSNTNCTTGTFDGCTLGFNATHMDYANIGTLSTFPFAAAATPAFLSRPDLILALEADSIPGNDGDPISTFSNRSVWGSAEDFTQSGSLRPILKKNVINGHAVIRADGVDDVLNSTAVMQTATGFTLAMVFQFPVGLGSGAHSYLWWLRGGNTMGSVGLAFNGVSGYHSIEIAADANPSVTNYVGFNVSGFDTHPHLLVVTFNPLGGDTPSHADVASYSAWWDGVAQTITQSTAGIAMTPEVPNGLTSVGGTPADLAAFYLVRAPLRPREVTSLIASLRATYGI